MINRFLRAKHWQLFILTFGVLMIFQFVMMGTVFASIGNGIPPDPSEFFSLLAAFMIFAVISSAILYGWMWSIAIGLQSKVPANVKMKVGRFKLFFFIPIVYMFFFLTGMGVLFNVMSGAIESGVPPDPAILFGSFALVFPLHLFAMFCMFYCIYFVAKTFKTAELQRETTFSDFIGEFFLVWFYPVGVWILQPKINKMVNEARGPGKLTV